MGVEVTEILVKDFIEKLENIVKTINNTYYTDLRCSKNRKDKDSGKLVEKIKKDLRFELEEAFKGSDENIDSNLIGDLKSICFIRKRIILNVFQKVYQEASKYGHEKIKTWKDVKNYKTKSCLFFELNKINTRKRTTLGAAAIAGTLIGASGFFGGFGVLLECYKAAKTINECSSHLDNYLKPFLDPINITPGTFYKLIIASPMLFYGGYTTYNAISHQLTKQKITDLINIKSVNYSLENFTVTNLKEIRKNENIEALFSEKILLSAIVDISKRIFTQQETEQKSIEDLVIEKYLYRILHDTLEELRPEIKNTLSNKVIS